MITVKVDFRNAPKEFRRLFPRNVRYAINNTLRTARDIVRGRVKKNRKGKHTARLFETVNLQAATISTLSGDLSTDNAIWKWFEEDTDPHVIKPTKPKGVLAFTPKGSTQVVFAKKVNHPGTKGHHYWEEAREFVDDVYPIALGMAVNAALAGQEFTAGASIDTSGPMAPIYNPL